MEKNNYSDKWFAIRTLIMISSFIIFYAAFYFETGILFVIGFILLLIIVLNGIVELWEKYSFVVVLLYFVVLFPIAFIHSLFLGWLGSEEPDK